VSKNMSFDPFILFKGTTVILMVMVYVLLWYVITKTVEFHLATITKYGREKYNLTRWMKIKYRIVLIMAAIPVVQFIPAVIGVLTAVFAGLKNIAKAIRHYLSLFSSLR
jgi:hypothetical protein